MTVICGRGKARVRGRRRDRARWSVSRGDAEEAASLVGFVMCSGCGVIADYSLLSKIEKCLFPELNAGMRMRASQVLTEVVLPLPDLVSHRIKCGWPMRPWPP